MSDVAAEAGRNADQQIQENKRNLLNGCQREFTNRGNRDGEDPNEENLKSVRRDRDQRASRTSEPKVTTTDHFSEDQSSLAEIYNNETQDPADAMEEKETEFDIPNDRSEDPVRAGEERGDMRAEDIPVENASVSSQPSSTEEQERLQQEQIEQERLERERRERENAGQERNKRTAEEIAGASSAAAIPLPVLPSMEEVCLRHREINEQYKHVIEVTRAAEEERTGKFQEYSAFVKDLVGERLDKVKEQTPGMSDKVEEFREAFNTRMDNFADTSEKAYENVEKLLEENPMLKEAVNEVVDTTRFIADPVGCTVEQGCELYESLKDDLTEILDIMEQSEADLVEEVSKDGIGKDVSFNEAIDKTYGDKALGDGETALAERTKELSEEINKAFEGVKKIITGGSEEQVQEGVEQLRESVNGFKKATEEINNSLGITNDEIDPKDVLQYQFKDDIEEELAIEEHTKEGFDKVAEAVKNAGENAEKVTNAVKNAEKAKKVGEILKNASVGVAKYSTKVGISGMVGAAALSNPWSAAVFVAVQIAIRSVQYAKAQQNEHQREVTSSLSDKETGSRATQDGAQTRSTKQTADMERS